MIPTHGVAFTIPQLTFRLTTTVAPPVAARRSERLVAHGVERVDDYYWLRQCNDPAVVDYLTAENEYTDCVLEPRKSLTDRLVAEMRSRIPEVDETLPYRDGPFDYYLRYVTNSEYPIYCRRRADREDAPEQVILDVNELAADHDYFDLATLVVSPDHSIAAFTYDTEGRRRYTLRFKSLTGTRRIFDEITDVSSDCEWANDGKTLFYVRHEQETLRDYQVWRHVLGQDEDTLVFEELDAASWVGIERSLSGRCLFINSAATTNNEIRYLDLEDPGRSPVLFLARETEHEYSIADGGDCFFVVSNANAPNFKLMRAPRAPSTHAQWQEVLGHREDVLIEGVEVFASFVAVSTSEMGADRVELIDRQSGSHSKLDFDEDVYSVYPDDNYEYESPRLRVVFESFTTPETTFDIDIGTRRRIRKKQQDVPGGYDPGLYTSKRLHVIARDGARIPVSLVYREDAFVAGTNPVLIYGYGAYGMSIEPEFDADLVSLLDRGFVYAIAHVRGGSECGRAWYFAGRQANKWHTFHDFLDVTRQLQRDQVGDPQRFFAMGGSAGGLLMGVVLNEAPELYRGVVAQVPFVDVVTTMEDSSVPLTTGEYDEWGNPAEAADFRYMLSYAPYDNVRAQGYPHLLVTAGLHDSQVQYWEPAKWVAKLRAASTGSNVMLLRTEMHAGHSGRTGRFQSLEATALEFAFLLTVAGIDE